MYVNVHQYCDSQVFQKVTNHFRKNQYAFFRQENVNQITKLILWSFISLNNCIYFYVKEDNILTNRN